MRSEGYSTCVSVCLSVRLCLLPRFLTSRARIQENGDSNGFSATLA